MKTKIVTIIIFGLLITLQGCSISDSAMQERALADAGDNAGEISRFLDRYDGEKKEDFNIRSLLRS